VKEAFSDLESDLDQESDLDLEFDLDLESDLVQGLGYQVFFLLLTTRLLIFCLYVCMYDKISLR